MVRGMQALALACLLPLVTAVRVSLDSQYEYKLRSLYNVEPDALTRWRALLALSSPPAHDTSSTESAGGDEASQQETAIIDECNLQQDVDLYVSFWFSCCFSC